jgi:hypothetical protein
MLILLIILIAMVGAMGTATVLTALGQKESITPELEAPVSQEPEVEIEWLEEDWSDKSYIDMIHTTRTMEQEALGYVATPCRCEYHKNLDAYNLAEAEREWNRTNFIDLDIDKVNARTRAQKLETYRTYYLTKDEPGYKEVENIKFEKWRDEYGREHLRAASIPPAKFGKAIDKVIPTSSIMNSYVSDPYSEKMRLKEELYVLQRKLHELGNRMTSDSSYGSGYLMRSGEWDAYKTISDRIKELKSALAGEQKTYRRGGEVVTKRHYDPVGMYNEYVIEDDMGRVIKQWKEGKY